MTDPGCGFALKFLVQSAWNPISEEFCVCLDLNLLLILVYSNSVTQQQSETTNLMLIELFGNWVSSFNRRLISVNCTSSENLFFTSSGLIFLLCPDCESSKNGTLKCFVWNRWKYLTSGLIWDLCLHMSVCTWGEYSTSMWLWVVKCFWPFQDLEEE